MSPTVLPIVRRTAVCSSLAILPALLLAQSSTTFADSTGSAMPTGTAMRSDAADADARARRLVAAMTLDEKIAMVHTRFGVTLAGRPQPAGALASAGFNPGLPRLGIPPLQETDAGLGVANPTNADYDATAMPSALALGSTFDPKLAFAAGAAVGTEARAMGFSLLLGGGANLIREPRGGRNFEFVSEDPLLTGTIVGSQIAGVQSRKVASTIKHFALNDQENGRVVLNAKLAEAPFRESDLLAFELALERGRPAAVMSSYNRVNGTYSSENQHLLTDVLKRDWAFAGWVLADWGGTHSTEAAALAGLDQESGEEDDNTVYFGAPLKRAVETGRVAPVRLDDMARRILRAQIAIGIIDDPPKRGGDMALAEHAVLARQVAGRGMVLLKNERDALPLSTDLKHLLVVGGHADVGVLSGGGSSQVVPRGSKRFDGVPAKLFYGQPRLFDPASPLAALRRAMPASTVEFVDGQDKAVLAKLAKAADAVVVFADRWANESLDLDGLTLPFEQDATIAAAVAANPRTIVVLETSGGVTMPWLSNAAAVVEAWYPGSSGGDSVADVLTGVVDPTGRLPVSFPRRVEDLPRPILPDRGKSASYPKEALKTPSFDVDYDIEGADVGYKWYLRTGRTPLFPFGFGLSYTRFAVSDVDVVEKSDGVEVAFDVRNVGARRGTDTPQVYVDHPGFTRRLAGWAQVALAPGATDRMKVRIDPRLLASFDVAADGWRIEGGRYEISVRSDAIAAGPSVSVELSPRFISARRARSLAAAR